MAISSSSSRAPASIPASGNSTCTPIPVPEEMFPLIAHHKFIDGQIRSTLPGFLPYSSMTLNLIIARHILPWHETSATIHNFSNLPIRLENERSFWPKQDSVVGGWRSVSVFWEKRAVLRVSTPHLLRVLSVLGETGAGASSTKRGLCRHQWVSA